MVPGFRGYGVLGRKVDAKLVNRSTLQKLIYKWQHRLKLQHWDIDFEIVSEREMPGKLGQVVVTPDALHAHISILDEAGRKSSASNDTDSYVLDIEDTVVHELLHLWFDALCAPNAKPVKVRAMEQAIVRIADALIQSDRQIPRKAK